MPCKIDWDVILTAPSLADRMAAINEQIDLLLDQYGTLPLSDCIMMRPRGGYHFIIEMDKRQKSPDVDVRRKGLWKLRMLVHPDGTLPKPGDEFRWQVGEETDYIDEFGQKVPMNNIEKERRMRFCKKPGDRWDWRKWRVHTLDDDCCFECSYYDAMALLTNSSALSRYEPTNESGVHYHLVEEVVPEDAPAKKGK